MPALVDPAMGEACARGEKGTPTGRTRFAYIGGCCAPPASFPHKNKNKSCLSKVGSVWLLSLKVEPCWLGSFQKTDRKVRQKNACDEDEWLNVTSSRRLSGFFHLPSSY